MATGTETGVHEIFDLSSDYLDRMAALKPISATYLGIGGHDHKWDDLTPEGGAALRAFVVATQARVAALPPTEDRWAKLAVGIMNEHLALERSYFDDGDDELDLNNIASTFQNIRQVFDVMNTATPAAWDAIITRVETIGAPLDGYRQTLAQGLAKGRTVAVRQVKAVVEQARVQQGPESFFRRLPDTMKEAGVTDAALVARLDGRRSARVRRVRRVRRLARARVPPEGAPGRRRRPRALPAPDAPLPRHRRSIPRRRTRGAGARSTPSRRRCARSAARSCPAPSLPQVLELLKTDKSRAAKDRDTFVRLMLERQLRALKELDGTHFDIPEPVRSVEVKIAPPGGALGAYYIQPSEDLSRPGTVWYSLAPDEQHDLPLYEHITTAYHEGFPGHHLQCAIQLTLAGRLSRLHRLAVWYPGYGEGWALYAEQLMNELGYFEKPDYVLGMLNAQLFRACRVVIDIGCHLGLKIPAERDAASTPARRGRTRSASR